MHRLPPPGNAAPEDAFLFVKGKSFTMGKPGGSGYDHLKPHKVTVSSFYICEFPVRQPAYLIDTMPDPQNTLAFDASKWTVSCNTEVDGYRLPLDAEWECAYSLFQTNEYTREWCGDSVARQDQQLPSI